MGNYFSSPDKGLLKVHFPCINRARLPLFIHSILPVVAWVFIAFGTAFYAITRVSRAVNARLSNFQDDRKKPTKIIPPCSLIDHSTINR